jgi:CRISPR-associated protein Csb2
MPSDLRITIHFLQPYSHGRGEDGSPEWPPSPLRMFQALVAAVAARGATDARAKALAALRWLERQPPPEIVAPAAHPATGYRLYVPDNVGDKVGQAWAVGRSADIADYRTEKDVFPMRLEGASLHYVFRDIEGVDEHIDALRAAARSVTHLGWGIDMVAADAATTAEPLEGERWIPGKRGGPSLRWCVPGTFDALEQRHSQFLRRLEGGVFRPVSPLTAYVSVPYAKATDPTPRAIAPFRLVAPLTADRLSFEPARRARDIAAWVRHAVGELSEHWPFGEARSIVHGHDPRVGEGAASGPRLSFLPLPTITPRRAEGIARVLVVPTQGLDAQTAWLRAHLAGQELIWRGRVIAMLEPLPESDWVLRQYVGKSDRWSTVTPVVLPGHDDHSRAKAERLIRKAFLQAGLAPELVDGIRELAWRQAGFRPGVEHASRYLPPDKVSGPRYHVRVRFPEKILGPLAVGSGRYRGVGVFAIDGE